MIRRLVCDGLTLDAYEVVGLKAVGYTSPYSGGTRCELLVYLRGANHPHHVYGIWLPGNAQDGADAFALLEAERHRIVAELADSSGQSTIEIVSADFRDQMRQLFERAASRQAEPLPPPKRSFWRRLFGRGS